MQLENVWDCEYLLFIYELITELVYKYAIILDKFSVLYYKFIEAFVQFDIFKQLAEIRGLINSFFKLFIYIIKCLIESIVIISY